MVDVIAIGEFFVDLIVDRSANAVSALKITRMGALNVPSRQEVEEYLEHSKTI